MEAVPLRAAVLMCHAPIVIPAIGGSRGAECVRTTRAMEEAARTLANSGARTVVVLSPHAPRHPRAFGCYEGPHLRGDFSQFGVRGIEHTFEQDPETLAAFRRTCTEEALPLESLGGQPLDHGALVPLHFLAEAGFTGDLLVLGFPWESTQELRHAFGHAIAKALNGLARPWALLASGDMSHRLQPGAPAGYHPRAHEFDAALVELVKAQRYGQTHAIGPELRELAAEDAVDSLDIASAVLGAPCRNARFLHYESPFGVGYLEAVLHQEAAS